MTNGFSAWACGSSRQAALQAFWRCLVLGLLCPGLSPSAFAALTLEEILERVGSQVESFWQHYPRVTCTQSLTQSKLNEKGKEVIRKQSTYDYTVSLGFEGADLAIGEMLVPKNPVPQEAGESLLVSQGFSVLVMIFHPHFRESFQYALESDEVVRGRRMHRVRFEQKQQNPSPSLLQIHGKDLPIEWQGTAWIDAETLAITKIQTRLKGSLQDLGLVDLHSDVTYGSVRYQGGESDWLPQIAVVEAHSRRQHWRNVHRFSDYKRFTVDTKITLGDPL